MPVHVPRIAVIGAGAIGGFLGVMLAKSGADMSVIARGATLAAIRDQGWILEQGAERIVARVRAEAEAKALGTQDVLILAVKAHALANVAPLAAAMIGPETIVIPALNGVPWWFTEGAVDPCVRGRLASVDPHGVIAESIPTSAIVGCVVYPACSTPAPGVSRLNSGTLVVFGETGAPAGAPPSERLSALVEMFKRAGFDVRGTNDIRTEVWKKLLGNACFNPVSLLTGSPTDRLIDDPKIHALFVAMMHETIAVGRALGIDVAIEPAARIEITRKLGNVKTSMLQDAEANRPVEIEAILGALIELSERVGTDMAVSKTVYALARMRAQTFGLLKG